MCRLQCGSQNGCNAGKSVSGTTCTLPCSCVAQHKQRSGLMRRMRYGFKEMHSKFKEHQQALSTSNTVPTSSQDSTHKTVKTAPQRPFRNTLVSSHELVCGLTQNPERHTHSHTCTHTVCRGHHLEHGAALHIFRAFLSRAFRGPAKRVTHLGIWLTGGGEWPITSHSQCNTKPIMLSTAPLSGVSVTQEPSRPPPAPPPHPKPPR